MAHEQEMNDQLKVRREKMNELRDTALTVII
jgi:hypothetical protein